MRDWSKDVGTADQRYTTVKEAKSRKIAGARWWDGESV